MFSDEFPFVSKVTNVYDIKTSLDGCNSLKCQEYSLPWPHSQHTEKTLSWNFWVYQSSLENSKEVQSKDQQRHKYRRVLPYEKGSTSSPEFLVLIFNPIYKAKLRVPPPFFPIKPWIFYSFKSFFFNFSPWTKQDGYCILKKNLQISNIFLQKKGKSSKK